MQNITLAFSDGPKAVFALFAAGVLPDHHRAFENSGTVVEADAPITQRFGVLGVIPLKLHYRKLRLTRSQLQGSTAGSLARRWPRDISPTRSGRSDNQAFRPSLSLGAAHGPYPPLGGRRFSPPRAQDGVTLHRGSADPSRQGENRPRCRVGLSRSVAATRTAQIGAELPVVEALRSGKWPTSDPRQVGSEGWCGVIRGRLPVSRESQLGLPSYADLGTRYRCASTTVPERGSVRQTNRQAPVGLHRNHSGRARSNCAASLSKMSFGRSCRTVGCRSATHQPGRH